MDKKEELVESRKPNESPFRQQNLKAWQPLLTPFWVIGTFLVTGALFLGLGGLLFVYSNQVVEVEIQYDVTCPAATNASLVTNCTVEIPIASTMSPPIYFYYKLTNYYQNHRRYVKSRSDPQLSDTSTSTDGCSPMDVWNGQTLYPCGLIAQTLFNDTFLACVGSSPSNCATLSGNDWSDDGIAWASDISKKFIQRPLDAGETSVGPGNFPIYVSDQHFMVWMRTAGLPSFRKLNRIINTATFTAGSTVFLTIQSVYPVSSFSGTKSVVFSTTTWLGGKNDFIWQAYIVVGAICFSIGLLFLGKQWLCPRKMGESTLLQTTKR